MTAIVPPDAAILALAPNWLGDAAMCTPALRAVRHRYPAATLTVAGRPAVCALLEGLPWLDAVEPIPPRPNLRDLVALGRRLAPKARDAAVVFPHGFRAALLAWLTRAQVRLGYDRGGRSLLLTHKVPPHRENGQIAPVYMTREYLGLAEALGCSDDERGLELATPPEAVARVREVLGPHRPKIGLAPGAAFGPSKQWPVERYARVAEHLTHKLGAQCCVLTGPDERETRAALLESARVPIAEPDGGTPSIAMLKASIAELDLLIGNDSGPRHVAVAFGVPVVCIMGPTKPVYSCGPYERGQVLRVDVDCGPCQQPTCRTDHRCMTRIGVDWVVEAAAAILAGERQGGR